MARLPDIGLDTPRAERPTTQATFDAGDLGLGKLAQDVGRVAQVYEKQREDDAQGWAQKTLGDWRIERDTEIRTAAETYDGAEPGLTRRVLDHADGSFATLSQGVSDPVRLRALQDAYDGYRAQQGANLSQIEASKRAEPLKMAQQTAEDVSLSTALFAVNADFQTRSEALADPAQALTAWDAAVEAAAPNVPEALRPRFMAKAANMRLNQGLKAAEVAEAQGEATMAIAANQNLDTVTNGLLSNPAGYRDATALLPTIVATLPAQLRPKFEAEAKSQVAGAYVQGLINRELYGVAKQQLGNGSLDTVLAPNAKQQFLNQLETAERVAARAARIAARGGGDDGDDGLEGPSDGTGGLSVGGLQGKPFDNTKAGFATDPIEYALGDKKRAAMAPVAPMDPNAGLADGAGKGDWGKALQQRAALGAELGSAYGVPRRMLTNAERAFFNDAFNRDPTAAVKLATNANAAVGPGFAQQLIREISGERDPPPNAVLHLADLAAAGGAGFANKAAQGMALVKQGQDVAPADKKFFDTEFEALRGTMAPEALIAAKSAAMNAWIADHANGMAAEKEFYARRALGGTSMGGERYGGRTALNGATVLLPGWLNPTSARDALATLGGVWAKHDGGPRFENGKAMTAADIARRSLKLMPNGWYQLVNPQTGTVAMQANGKPFMFDLDRDRAFLGKTLGAKAVLGAK